MAVLLTLANWQGLTEKWMPTMKSEIGDSLEMMGTPM